MEPDDFESDPDWIIYERILESKLPDGMTLELGDIFMHKP
jgi:hypothetical protein